MLKKEVAIELLSADKEVLDFIYDINSYGFEVKCLFEAGYCYYFSIILKTRFPEAQIYLSKKASHFITKIGNCYYDIDGCVYDDVCFEELVPIEELDEETIKRYMH